MAERLSAHPEILAAVWRAVACADDLSAVCGEVLRAASAALPARGLSLWRLEIERGSLRELASSRPAKAGEARAASRELTDVQAFLSWCRRGELLAWKPGAPTPGMAAPDAGSARTFGALGSNGRTVGLAEWEQDSRGAWGAEERALAEALLEPLTVALANRERLQELAVSKEAAEADRTSLLRRLGKEELRETIVGASAGLREVLERVALVARTDAPVLLLGETGSGKEVVARALHEASPAASRPFLRVNCGAIPPQLIDSELFGHERGSFTGASATRLGWFERAHRGTLFLDEVAELTLDAQVRLLRVLQDGTFERVGGGATIQVDVRLVAATHQDLGEMVARGTFRRDLWYRISVFPISIPPLRERPEDLPALALHFAQKSARKLGLAFQAPSSDDLGALLSYAWPGNVRELAAVMERAVILGKGQRLETQIALGLAGPARAPAAKPAAPAEPSAGDALDAAHIERALAASHGRVEGPFGAAAALRVAPHVLRARMKRLGLDAKRFRGG